MTYVRYATSDTIYALNDDNWKVEIMRNDVGQSNNHKFEVGPAGVQLIYESPEDDILVPGIVHSRCEVETIWPPDVADELDDMIEAMVDSADGVWFMQIYKGPKRYWFGPILIDEVQLQESSAARSCRIVASDGISLLKTIDYNNAGVEYTAEQIIFDDVLINIQEKWVSYDYANQHFSLAEKRLAVCDDMYSQDIYTVTTTPPDTDEELTRHMKLSPHMFSYTNDDDEVEYINCYDLLDSICKTLLLRLYYHEAGWWLMPCYNITDEVTGYWLNWSGTNVSGGALVDAFNYQVDTLNNEKQKGNEWTYTFTPAINEVTINRDTNNGSIVLGQTEISGGSAIYGNAINFTTGDSGYILYGNILVERSALSPTVGILNDDRLGRYVLQLSIRFGTSAGNYQYYQNTISAQPQGLFSWSLPSISIDGNSMVFTPLNITEGEYSNSSGYYYWHDTNFQNCIFDANEDNSSQIFFNLQLPSVPSDLSAVQITASILCYDRDGNYSQDLQDTIDTQTYALYFTYGSDTVEPAPSYDVVANSTFGRGSIDLGKTYIGELHQNVGGIMVETSAGVFQTTNDWSTMRYDYDGECNQIGVREVLAAHYKPRRVERGNIVMRGNGVVRPPFWMFVDDDTSDIYQCINYRFASTPAEVEVTLHKVGTDGQAQTTSTGKQFGKSPLPDPGPGLGEGGSFGVGFTSGFDFNGDAADAFGQDYSSVFTGETIEAYVTHVGPSKGNYFDFQGNTAPSGQNVQRKIYTSVDGLADATNTWAEIDAAYRPTKNQTLRDAIKSIDTYTARTASPNRSFIITYQTVGSGLLQDYQNAQAAYSVRKLDSNYTGNAMQVRNDSGTLLNIGFDSNGDLDTASILTHIGTGDGRVATWYDQSGNGRNATQTTVGLMPKIAEAGVVLTVNGKPAIDWNTDNLDTASFAPNPNGAYNFAMVSQYDVINITQASATGWASSTGHQNYLQQMQSNGKMRWAVRYSGASLPRPDMTSSAAIATQYIQTATFATGTCEAYYNGVQELDKFSQLLTGTPNNHSVVHRIGALNTTGTQQIRGYIQEFVIWSNATPLDAEDISEDLNTYYQAY